MAKGLRSNRKQGNRSKLRSRIFAPVEDARTERLSAKLLELASQPKPERTEMEVEKTDSKDDSQTDEQPQQQDESTATAMDVDSTTAPAKSKPKRKSNRIHKKHRRAKNDIVFRVRKPDGRRLTGHKSRR